jgi:hypothetical protein
MKAFPNHRSEGMDLRDYFAAKAMQKREWIYYYGENETKESLKKDADACYAIADAMMKARENNEQTTT